MVAACDLVVLGYFHATAFVLVESFHMTSSNFRRLHYALLNTAFCVILIMATPALSFGQNAPPKAILANAAKVQANGQISFCGFYLGMPEVDAKTLAAYHGLDNK